MANLAYKLTGKEHKMGTDFEPVCYNFIKIDDLDAPELRPYNIRSEVQLFRANEPDPGVFICESPKVILRALDAGYEPISVLTALDDPDDETREVYERCSGVPIYLGGDEVLREIAGYALTGGVFALMRRRELKSISELIGRGRVNAGKTVIAVLENVQNPTNVGSIFRSAAAMGINAIILTSDSSDPLYRRAERVSMGTVFQIPWTVVDKDQDYLNILHENGFTTVAMALSDNSVDIRDPEIKKSEKLAVILGSEGYGLCEDTIKRSSFVAKIPMNPIVDSLNVGAASAVMFWELTR